MIYSLSNNITHTLTSTYISQTFNYTDSDFMKDAGMKVEPRALTIAGQVIQTPRIKYGNNEIMVIPCSDPRCSCHN